MTDIAAGAPAKRPLLNISLWAAQVLLAALFCMSGLLKLLTPIAELSVNMPWTGQTPLWFVRAIGVIDLAGGIGVLAPALLRIWPRLSVVAAFCCVVLQVLAIAFHVSRGEFGVLSLNAVLISLAVFVLWGRSRAVVIRR